MGEAAFMMSWSLLATRGGFDGLAAKARLGVMRIFQTRAATLQLQRSEMFILLPPQL